MFVRERAADNKKHELAQCIRKHAESQGTGDEEETKEKKNRPICVLLLLWDAELAMKGTGRLLNPFLVTNCDLSFYETHLSPVDAGRMRDRGRETARSPLYLYYIIKTPPRGSVIIIKFNLNKHRVVMFSKHKLQVPRTSSSDNNILCWPLSIGRVAI